MVVVSLGIQVGEANVKLSTLSTVRFEYRYASLNYAAHCLDYVYSNHMVVNNLIIIYHILVLRVKNTQYPLSK